jgi:hypothetical protein
MALLTMGLLNQVTMALSRKAAFAARPTAVALTAARSDHLWPPHGARARALTAPTYSVRRRRCFAGDALGGRPSAWLAFYIIKLYYVDVPLSAECMPCRK